MKKVISGKKRSSKKGPIKRSNNKKTKKTNVVLEEAVDDSKSKDNDDKKGPIKRSNKKTTKKTNVVVDKAVDDCESEDNDNDSEQEYADDNPFRNRRPGAGSYIYGMRTVGYQFLFASKGMTPIGQPPFMVFFNNKVYDSFSNKDNEQESDRYHKTIEVKMLARRKKYPKNVPVEVMDKNSDGSWRQIPQLVYVREVPAVIPNTTDTLRQWAKLIAKEVKNQGAQYPVELGFGRYITVLDENNELKSVDTVLMDDDAVRLVKKRYRKVLKNNNGEAFFSGPKLHKYFEAGRNISEICALFG